MTVSNTSTSLRARLGKLAVAATVFATIVGGWAWAGPLIVRRLPLPDTVSGPAARCPLWVIGSSTVERWSALSRDLPGWQVHNRGINGALLDQIGSRLEATPTDTPPRVIVFYSGENDINSGASGARVAADMIAMIDQAQHKWRQVPIFVIALKPSPVRWPQRPEQLAYNARLAAYAQRTPAVTYLPAGAPLMKGGLPDPALYVDGVHMNDRGYLLWSRDVRRGLDAALPADVRAACTKPGES